MTEPSVKIFMSVGGMRELKLSKSSCAAVGLANAAFFCTGNHFVVTGRVYHGGLAIVRWSVAPGRSVKSGNFSSWINELAKQRLGQHLGGGGGPYLGAWKIFRVLIQV